MRRMYRMPVYVLEQCPRRIYLCSDLRSNESRLLKIEEQQGRCYMVNIKREWWHHSEAMSADITIMNITLLRSVTDLSLHPKSAEYVVESQIAPAKKFPQLRSHIRNW